MMHFQPNLGPHSSGNATEHCPDVPGMGQPLLYLTPERNCWSSLLSPGRNRKSERKERAPCPGETTSCFFLLSYEEKNKPSSASTVVTPALPRADSCYPWVKPRASLFPSLSMLCGVVVVVFVLLFCFVFPQKAKSKFLITFSLLLFQDLVSLDVRRESSRTVFLGLLAMTP